MIFFKKKVIETEQSAIIDLKKRVNALENDILDVNITLTALKGKILKKIQNKKPEIEEETQNLYNSVLVKE